MEARAWTRPEIEQFLASERLSYQRIQLPFGLETPGESEARVASWYDRRRDFIRAEYPKADYRELAPIPEAR